MSTDTSPHAVTVDVENDRARIAIVGRLDATNRDRIKSILDIPLGAGATTIVVDLSQCTAADTVGLGALITCARRVRAVGGRLSIDGLHEDLRRLFAQTKLDEFFDHINGPTALKNVESPEPS